MYTHGTFWLSGCGLDASHNVLDSGVRECVADGGKRAGLRLVSVVPARRILLPFTFELGLPRHELVLVPGPSLSSARESKPTELERAPKTRRRPLKMSTNESFRVGVHTLLLSRPQPALESFSCVRSPVAFAKRGDDFAHLRSIFCFSVGWVDGAVCLGHLDYFHHTRVSCVFPCSWLPVHITIVHRVVSFDGLEGAIAVTKYLLVASTPCWVVRIVCKREYIL